MRHFTRFRYSTVGIRSYFLPVVPARHALLIDGPIQFFDIGKDGLVVDDDRLDDLVDVGLARDLVLAVWCGHECWAKTYGQVVWVHHVLIAVLGQTEGRDGGKMESEERLEYFSIQYFRQIIEQGQS